MPTTVTLTVTYDETVEDTQGLCDSLAESMLPDYTCSAESVMATTPDGSCAIRTRASLT